MNAIRQEGGRVNQKRRTRLAIVQAAADLAAEGLSPSVADAADAAGVSRATAYRYFSTQEELLIEALLHSAVPDVDAAIAALDDPDDVEARLIAVMRAISALTLPYEHAFRAMLKGSLDVSSGPRLRGGRRMGWFERVLEPVRDEIDQVTYDRLVAGLSILCGVETLIVLRDVVGINDESEIRQTIESSAVAMLRGTLPAKT